MANLGWLVSKTEISFFGLSRLARLKVTTSLRNRTQERVQALIQQKLSRPVASNIKPLLRPVSHDRRKPRLIRAENFAWKRGPTWIPDNFNGPHYFYYAFGNFNHLTDVHFGLVRPVWDSCSQVAPIAFSLQSFVQRL